MVVPLLHPDDHALPPADQVDGTQSQPRFPAAERTIRARVQLPPRATRRVVAASVSRGLPRESVALAGGDALHRIERASREYEAEAGGLAVVQLRVDSRTCGSGSADRRGGDSGPVRPQPCGRSRKTTAGSWKRAIRGYGGLRYVSETCQRPERSAPASSCSSPLLASTVPSGRRGSPANVVIRPPASSTTSEIAA